MKNINALKNIFVMMILAIFMFACEDKDKDPSPELSAQVEGSYKVTELTVDGKERSLEDAVIIVQLNKLASETVTGKMKVKIEGDSEPDENLGTLNLKNAGSTGIDIYEGAEKVGNVKSGKMSIFVVYEGEDLEIIAEKQ